MKTETLKGIRRAARKLFRLMPTGGRHGSKKGKRGYSRRPKHPKRGDDDGR